MAKATVEELVAVAVSSYAIAKSDDAEKTAYTTCADALIELRAMGLTHDEIAAKIGRTDSTVRTLIKWREDGRKTDTPWGGSELAAKKDREKVNRITRENPEVIVQAFAKAPTESRKTIARELSTAPEVKKEVHKRDLEEANLREIQIEPDPRHSIMLFEGKLDSAYFSLRGAVEVLSGLDIPGGGEDEDIIAMIDKITEITKVIDEMYRSGRSLDTAAAEWLEAR